MVNYEIRSPSRHKGNVWFKIFHKNNSRASIRSLKSGDLIDVLNEWDNYNNNYINHSINNSINLKRCLKKNENIMDFKSIVIIKHNDGKWFKICLYNKKEDKYYFRTITSNDIEWQRENYKELIISQDSNWYIDLSGMEAPSFFWYELKLILNLPISV